MRARQHRPVEVVACTVDGCDNGATDRGLCMKHYMRWYRTGDPAGVVEVRGSTRRLVKRRTAG